MSLLNHDSCARLSEQFADILQRSQDDYRALLNDLRDDDVDVRLFTERAEALTERLIKLKRIRVQIGHERDLLQRTAAEESAEKHGSDQPLGVVDRATQIFQQK